MVHIKRFALLFFCFSLYLATIAQINAPVMTHSWDDQPSIHTISDDDLNYPAVQLQKNLIIEHRLEYGETNTYYSEHSILHINNDAGIEKFNKIYIPLNNNRQLLNLQVRAISPDGSVTEIQRQNIKELENVNGVSNVKIFAIEGLEVGGEAEYLYQLRGKFQAFGRSVAQKEIPVKDFKFLLKYPKKWVMKTKSYNGLPVAEYGTPTKKVKSIVLKAKNLPAFVEEDYSASDASLMKVDYKITSNGYASNLFTWNYLSKGLISNLSAKKGVRTGEKFIKNLPPDLETTEEKVKALESKIKSTITISRGANPAYYNPKEIVANGVGNENGITKLYLYCLQALGIKSEVVFCSSRFKGTIDPEFANVTDINEVLIYVPEIEKYIAPGYSHLRLGAAPSNVSGSKGLFISHTLSYSGGRLEHVFHQFKDIEPLPLEQVHQGVHATIDFSQDISLPVISQENYLQGYRAFRQRGQYFYADEKGKEDLFRNTILSSFETFDVIEKQLEGEDIELSSNEDAYFRTKTKYTTPELVEKVGTDYLIGIGKIIGKQSELYQESERKMDIVFSSTANYDHKLSFKIPEGYKVEGLESVTIDNRVTIDSEDLMYFTSEYSVENDTVTITAQEVYNALQLPVKQYPAFRAVINSAADFNKVTLLLTPK